MKKISKNRKDPDNKNKESKKECWENSKKSFLETLKIMREKKSTILTVKDKIEKSGQKEKKMSKRVLGKTSERY